jgi:hypothetical protein
MGIIIVVVHGGERVANLFSLTFSCDRLKREPDAYLCDIVPRLSSHPEREIWKLTPRGWRNSRALVEAEAADSTGTGDLARGALRTLARLRLAPLPALRPEHPQA